MRYDLADALDQFEQFPGAPAKPMNFVTTPHRPTLLATIAEFESELIRERTGEGRKRAMANGVKN